MKHVVGFSGGADSQACAWWVRQRFPAEDIVLLNSDAGGNEHPLTMEFIAWYSGNVFPVVTVTAEIRDLGNVGTKPGATRDRRQQYQDSETLTFDRLAFVKGRFPSPKAQFCTEYLKLMPFRRWIEENLIAKRIEFERYIGVRCDESNERRETPDRKWDEYFGTWINYPIRCWTKEEVFAVLKQAGEQVNPLYTLGFGRVGCAPCVNSNKQDIRNWAARFPAMIDKVREWERRVGRTFFAPIVPGKRINWIDEVVEWSRTEHGGKQYSLPILEAEAASGTCSSLYGLCE